MLESTINERRIQMNWWEVFGWAGSILVVVSLMIPSVRRFRILNLTGSLIATIYNMYFEIWPYAVMNGAIVLINIYWLYRLSREGKTADRGYSTVHVSGDDDIVTRFLSRHRHDISTNFPAFTAENLVGTHVRLILHEDEVIGIFAVRADGDAGSLVIDFVTERFRDFGPGAYIYSAESIFDEMSVSEIAIAQAHATDHGYFLKQGFTASGELLVRSV